MTYGNISASLLVSCAMLLSCSSIAGTLHFGFEPNQDPVISQLGPLGGLRHPSTNINTLPTLSGEKALSGSRSLKSYLHIYDSPVPYRSQALLGVDQYRFEFGNNASTKDYWIGFAVWIPEWFPARNPVGGLRDQFHEWHSSPKPGGRWECAGGNPIEMYFDQDSPTSGNVRVMLQGGQLANDCEKTGIGTPRRYVLHQDASATYTVGEWNTFVYNVRFDGAEGFFKLWVNGKIGIDYSGPLYHNWSGPAYPMWGHYLDWKSRKTNDPKIVERILYYDDIRITDDPSAGYNTVVPHIPSATLLPAPKELQLVQ